MRDNGKTDRDWKPAGRYAMVSGDWTVTKYIIDGKPKYGLWLKGKDKAIGYFSSFDKAKERVDA
jgi:hypothetical protein